MRKRQIPMRMCSGCGEMKPKKELIRVVKTKDGEICFDTTGKLAGRGAYVCKDVECLKKAEKANVFARAFEMNIDKQIYAKLREEIEKL